VHDFLQKREYSADLIVVMWGEMMECFTLKKIADHIVVYTDDHEKLKIRAMHTKDISNTNDVHMPADGNYSAELKDAVRREIAYRLLKVNIFRCVERDGVKELFTLLGSLDEMTRSRVFSETLMGQSLLYSVKSKKSLSLLVNAGFDIHKVDEDGNTPFHRLLCVYEIDVVTAFISYFRMHEGFLASAIDRPNKSGYTPLGDILRASIVDSSPNLVRERLVACLLGYGATLLQQGESNVALIEKYEKEVGSKNEILNIVKKSLPEFKNLHLQVELAEKILSLGAAEKSNCLALIQAFKLLHGSPSIQLEIFHPIHQKQEHVSFLHAACLVDDVETVKAIFSCFGKDVCLSLKDKEHTSVPLMFAAQGGALKVLTYLIEEGVNVSETQLRGGKTALDFAVKSEQVAAIQFLLDHGAPANNTEKLLIFLAENILSLDVADKPNYFALVERFKVLGGDPSVQVSALHCFFKERGSFSFLNAACLCDDLDTVTAIFSCFDKDVCLNLQDKIHGSFPLMFAAQGGALRVLAYLLKQGADVNRKSISSGITALDFAVAVEQTAAVQLLLMHGAEAVNIKELLLFKEQNLQSSVSLEPQRFFSHAKLGGVADSVQSNSVQHVEGARPAS
jgi:ankyrin repeat protein